MANQYTKFAQQKIRKSFCSIVVDDKLVDLAPLKMDYTGEMNGGILTLQIHQLYKNDVGDEHSPDRKAVLVLPRARTQCITGIDCLLNGKKIDLKIEEEKKAKEIAKEGEKQGRTTFRSENTPDEQYLNIHLGSLSYGSSCDITMRMEIISTNSDSKTYQTIIPFSEQDMKSTNNEEFSFSIVFNEILSISDVNVLCGYDKNDFEYTFDGSILTIDRKPLGPVIILTELSEDIPSQIQNDMHDEYSVISVIPHFLSKPVNSDFIFLVDCSGSMSGSRIRNASECLTIFLHSLPVGCRFNIIMFGSEYRSIFGRDGLVEYNEENLEIAENLIKNMKANMGGTNLLGPLREAYKESDEQSKKGNIVQIFILTDGEIHDTETVFKLVSKNRSKNRIFSIGIGKESDRDLVSGLAILSYGKFDFVTESIQITDKVVNLLSLSLAPALTNVTIHVSENQDSLEIVPNPLTPIYDGNLMFIYVKRESNSNEINEVLITGNIGEEEIEIVVDEVSNICDFSAKKLFALNAINDYETLYESKKGAKNEKEKDKEKEELEKLRDRIVTLSTENGILSKFTSYVGVEQNPHKEANQENEDEDEEDDDVDADFDVFTNESSRITHRHYLAKAAAPPRRPPAVSRAHVLGAAPPAAATFSHPMAAYSGSCGRSRGSGGGRVLRGSTMNFSSKRESFARNSLFDDDEENDQEQYEDDDDDEKEEASPKMSFSHKICAKTSKKCKSQKARKPKRAQKAKKCKKMSRRVSSSESDEDSEDFENEQIDKSECLFDICESAKESYREIDGIEKSETIPAKPPQKHASIENSVSGIVSSQDFDGKWKFSHFEQFFTFLGRDSKNSVNEFVDSLGIKDEEIKGNMKSTICALCLLNKFFTNEKTRWKLIELKAISWLNKNHPCKWEDEINKLLSKI